MPPQAVPIFAGILAILVLASAVGYGLSRRHAGSPAVANLNARIRAWWAMILISIVVLSLGRYGILVLFAILSLLCVREFAPKSGWHVLAVSIHYAIGTQLPWLPLYALVFPRDPQTRWGIILCGYALSFAAAITDSPLLLFYMVIVQASDVLQYIWGKLLGMTKIAPVLSPAKTLEGLIGGITSATAIGVLLAPALTPYTPVKAGILACITALAGFLSGLVFSAIKRSRGIKDWGTWLPGHGGMLDRLDSVCLSAPLFYWIVYFM